MNAIELLKQDHQIVDGLFKEVESTPPSRHPAIFKRIKGELDTHAHVEEVIFYPALKKRGDKDLVDSVLEGVEEHGQMKKFLGELASLTVEGETYEPKLKVLIEDTRHHVKEEEGIGGMFSMARDQLGDHMLDKIGEDIENEKLKFQEKHGIKPEPRVEAKGMIESIVDKAKKVVGDVFSSPESEDGKAKTASKKSGANGKTSTAKTSARPKGTTKSASAKSARSKAAAAKPKPAASKKAPLPQLSNKLTAELLRDNLAGKPQI